MTNTTTTEILARRDARIAAKKAQARKDRQAQQRDERAARADAIAMSESLTVHAPVSGTSGIAFCQCGQGFSGHRAVERRDEHIARPRTDDLGALLIAVHAS